MAGRWREHLAPGSVTPMRAMQAMTTLLLLACAAVPGSGSSTDSEPSPSFRFRFTASDQYQVGQPVKIGFTLVNASRAPLWVLKWYTPLEGIWGKILLVTRDGATLPYQGPLAKRGAPRREDYVRVQASQSVSAEFDLSKVYDLTVPGSYRVEFVGHLHDVAREGEKLPRDPGLERRAEASGEPASFRLVPAAAP